MADADVRPDSLGQAQTDATESRPAKRSRVTRACDQCRASREKCDGAQPSCQTCTSQDRACSYKEPPKKRGIQPNYIRTLELTLAWLFGGFPEAEAKLSASLPDPHGPAQSLINGKDATASEALHRSWREGNVNKQIDQMLSGASVQRFASSHGHESARITYVSPTPTTPAASQLDSSTSRLDLPGSVVGEMPGTGSPPVERRPQTLSNLPPADVVQLPTNAWNLLEYYFAFTHTWLPMTEKHSILKLMYSYPPAGVPANDFAAPEHAELWSILAVASRQVSGGSSGSHDDTQRIAERLLPQSLTNNLPHLKAMLLMSLLNIQDGELRAAWMRVGTVIRVLTLTKSNSNLNATDPWLKHVHLAAFVLENALASSLGASGHLTNDHITAIGSVNEDLLDEWSPWADPLDNSGQGQSRAPAKAFSTLNRLARLALQSLEGNTGWQGPDIQTTGTRHIVFALIQNAYLSEGRLQPSEIVDAHSRTGSTAPAQLPDLAPFVAPARSGALEYGLQALPTQPVDRLMESPTTHRSNPAISPLNTGLVPGSLTMPMLSQQTSDVLAVGFNATDTAWTEGSVTTDIFEELAGLERTESAQRPQFMQNLGFAPDIDLAEFFGEDYLPSNPLLTYMLPKPASSGMARDGDLSNAL